MLAFYLSLIETQEDKRLFEKIYMDYRQNMFNYAKKLLGDEGYAEDIVHDVFLSIIKTGVDKIQEIDNENHLWNYLSTAVRNQCISFAKKHSVHIAQEKEYNDQLGINLNEDSPLQESSYQFLVETIRDMKPTYADVLYFSIVHEMNSVQIAKLLNLEPAAVRQRISRGKKLLREKLGKDFMK